MQAAPSPRLPPPPSSSSSISNSTPATVGLIATTTTIATAGAGRAPVPLVGRGRQRDVGDEDEDMRMENGEGMPSERNRSGEIDASGTTTALPALPGIRDLFPDHLFEAQQRLEPLVDPRLRKTKDPFLSSASSGQNQDQNHTRSEREREMHREAFAALTAPFPRSVQPQTQMQPRSPYSVRDAFAFPGPSPTRGAVPPSTPSAATNFASSASGAAGSPLPHALAHTSVPPTSTSSRTETTRLRTHAHTHSSDASAAAAGLLGLSLSGGPPLSTSIPPTANAPASSTVEITRSTAQEREANEYRDRDHDHRAGERYPEGEWEEGDDNDDDSMFVFEMDDQREIVRGKGREGDKEDGEGMEMEMEMEGVETAPTSVDSHASVDAKSGPRPRSELEQQPKDLVPDRRINPKSKSKSKSEERGMAEPGSSAENDNGVDRDPVSSAENEGTEEGADGEGGEGEGEGEGGDGKRHTCPHCRKRFNRPSSLKIHLNTHTGAKPFECPYPGCGRQFNVSSNMRRHYRNHSSPAGFGPGGAPGMGVGMGMGMHEQFGPRPPPPGVLGLHVGPTGYPGPQHVPRHAQVQMEREMERGRIERERERMGMQGIPREVYPSYGPPHAHAHPHAAPSAYRAPPVPNGVGPQPPPGMSHVVPYGTYPPGFGPREIELERRERMGRMETENWILRERERERERIGRLERRERDRILSGYAQQAYAQTLPYAQHSPPRHERHLEYRMVGDPGRPVPVHLHHQQAYPQSVASPHIHPTLHAPPHPQSQLPPPPPHLQSQPRAPAPALRPSHSFSHPYAPPHAHPYARSPSQSQSRSRERYSSGAGSPARSPALSAASSLPVRGWRGHAHTHSAPAFAGPGAQRVELPPIMTSTRSPYERDVPLPVSHGRSHSYSVSNAQGGPPPSGHVRTVDAREEERRERRERRDSTAARTGHESELEGVPDSASDFEGEEKRAGSDVDMDDAVGKKGELTEPERDLPPGSSSMAVDAATRSIDHDGGEGSRPVSAAASAAVLSSPVHVLSPSSHQRTPSAQSSDLRRRTSHPQAVPVPSSSARERAYSHSHSHYSHSRTGSSSSSGHGHRDSSHPYARARHAHSRSREAGGVAADVISPLLSASMSTSPRPSVPSMSASGSPRASGSISSVSSPQGGRNATVLPLREPADTDRKSTVSSPMSASGKPSRFPVYTFPPPTPPPGVVLAADSPAGGTTMEVEN